VKLRYSGRAAEPPPDGPRYVTESCCHRTGIALVPSNGMQPSRVTRGAAYAYAMRQYLSSSTGTGRVQPAETRLRSGRRARLLFPAQALGEGSSLCKFEGAFDERFVDQVVDYREADQQVSANAPLLGLLGGCTCRPLLRYATTPEETRSNPI
jgi:hypothetical protein